MGSTKDDQRPLANSGRFVCWLALSLGGSMSVAANSLHVIYVVGPETGGVTVPQVVGAAFWPIGLMIAVEVIARVNWPDRKGYTILRWGGVGAVAVVAAIVSYRHMYSLMRYWGEETITAMLGPIGVDGLVMVGAIGLMASSYNTTATTKTQGVTRSAKEATPEETPAPPAAAPAKRETKQAAAASPPAAAISEPVREQVQQPEPTETPEAPVVEEFQQPPAPEPTSRLPEVKAESLAGVSGIPIPLQGRILNQLNEVIASGRQPVTDDLTALGLPAPMANKVITAACNGSH